MIKLNILAQGGLAVLRDAAAMMAGRGITGKLDQLEPWEDGAVWDMIAAGRCGGHHIEGPVRCGLARMAGVRNTR